MDETNYISITTAKPPNCASLQKRLGIPISVMIQPFHHGERLPEVCYKNLELIRCSRCMAHLNVFCKFVQEGRQWLCNMCNEKNRVPDFYFSPLDFEGERTEKGRELTHSSIDLIAPDSYMYKPPMPATYVFLMDVSLKAKKSGFLDVCISAVKSIEQFPGSPRTQVALIAYDSSVHIFQLSEDLKVYTVSETFIPVHKESLLIDYEFAGGHFHEGLEVLRSFPRVSESSAAREAVLLAHELLKFQGGKIVLFMHEPDLESNHPSELSYESNTTFYKDTAIQLSQEVISCDVFVSHTHYCNVLAYGELALYTGGELYFYPNFSVKTYSDKIHYEVWSSVTSTLHWECKVRTRFNYEWTEAEIHGHFFKSQNSLLNVGTISPHQTFTYTINMEHKTPVQMLYVQSSILYTSNDSVRKIRVHNAKFELSDSLQEAIKGIDHQMLLNIWTKKAINELVVRKTNPRISIENWCRNLMILCRDGVYNNIQLLCMGVLGMMKHPVLHAQGCKIHIDNINLDSLNYFRLKLESATAHCSWAWVYPVLYCLHESFKNPPVVHLSAQFLQASGIYLMDTGLELFLWIGKV